MMPANANLSQPSPRIANGASRFAIEVRASPIHRFGVFTGEIIASGERIIEYTGERISYLEAARRSVQPIVYLFWVAPGRIIDGSTGGSGAEFVNHSCEPNLIVDIAEGRVYFVSAREIACGEELLLDYSMRADDRDASPMPCRCGAPGCRGFLNAP